MNNRTHSFAILVVLFGSFLRAATPAAPSEAPTAEARHEARLKRFPEIPQAKLMVDNLLLPQGGLENEAVLGVMRRIPRIRFVPPIHHQAAYWDQAIAIGAAQTISPPYVVAYMTEQLDPKPGDKVLEIGTGSGYQAAVLSLLVDEVYTIEIVESLGKQSAALLKRLKMDNVHVRVGDGYKGWPEAAPFDCIIVTCSPESVPQPLVDQLREGGRMIIPLGERFQQSFYLCKKVDGKLEKEYLTQSLFVPMTGQAEEERQAQPDGRNPALVGGQFAEVRENGTPVGWHYARNVAIFVSKDGTGTKFARFTNAPPKKTENAATDGIVMPPEPFQFAQILQGFAVDGNAISKIRIEYEMCGEKIVARQGPVMTPTGVISFFDETRRQIDEIPLGRCTGTFDWKKMSRELVVKPEAREAIMLIGLPHASGQLDVRNISVQKTAGRR